jgi:hypothetical protein
MNWKLTRMTSKLTMNHGWTSIWMKSIHYVKMVDVIASWCYCWNFISICSSHNYCLLHGTLKKSSYLNPLCITCGQSPWNNHAIVL